ncbi:MAG: D-alanyl-D-alanine carboxypeptidase family protein [Ruminococcus sp.]|nr:D-alanyl-D-alanine carboxypeptidase family protein [Ruminococcus sp.]
MRKIISVISVLMLSGSLYAGSAMAENAVAGDVNGDGICGVADLNLVNDYVLGKIQFSENQCYSADMNGDSRVDSFDLVVMRRKLTVADAVLPVGKYTGVSENGIRHYTFFEGGGNYIDDSTGMGSLFAWEINGNNITVHISSAENTTNDVIEWTDENHFNIVWEDGTVEKFSPNRVEVIDGVTYIDGILIANKSYGLPVNYNPNGLTAETQKAFNEMASDASKDGLCLCVYSGFRSYIYQQQIYNNYVSLYGQVTADTFSARAGHSEHQTGLAIDVNCADDSFDGTPEALWLAENSWKYGFIIRYPKGKQDITGYKYEPWHVRYLGKETAEKVYRSGLTLEEYLGIDSVYK